MITDFNILDRANNPQSFLKTFLITDIKFEII